MLSLDPTLARQSLGQGPARPTLETVMDAFVAGARGEAIGSFPAHLHGFHWEGRRMAAGPELVADFEAPEWARPLVAVGLGLARAEAAWPPAPEPALAPWSDAVLDGHGFWAGFFRRRRTLADALRQDTEASFDRGVGRSLWFSCAGEARDIARAIERLHPGRAEALWHGVGLASAYAGGSNAEALDALIARAKRAHLVQGARLGLALHRAAGTRVPHEQVLLATYAISEDSLDDPHLVRSH